VAGSGTEKEGPLPAAGFPSPSIVPWDIQVMGADLPEMDSFVLLAHVDSDAEPAGVVRDQISRDVGGDIGFKK